MNYDEITEIEKTQEEGLFRGFSKDGKVFRAIQNQEVVDKLSPGVYKTHIDYDSGAVFFVKTESTHDNLINLPSSEFSRILSEMQNFLNPETKEKFKNYGFVYKRSCMLEGPPGTGKTCIANRIIQEVVNKGGIVLINPKPHECETFFDVLDSLQKDMTTMVVFEEFETHFKHGEIPENITSLLDGETQKENVMYLATTNHIEKIPEKIKRPGRFSSVIHVGSPSKEARQYYLECKLGKEDKDVAIWAEKTDGLTIDELKECVVAVKCLGYTIDETLERIGGLKGEREA